MAEFEAEIKQILADIYGLTDDFYEIKDIKSFLSEEWLSPYSYGGKCSFVLLMCGETFQCVLWSSEGIAFTRVDVGETFKIVMRIMTTLTKNTARLAELEAKIASLQAENAELRVFPGGPEYRKALARFDEMKQQ